MLLFLIVLLKKILSLPPLVNRGDFVESTIEEPNGSSSSINERNVIPDCFVEEGRFSATFGQTIEEPDLQFLLMNRPLILMTRNMVHVILFLLTLGLGLSKTKYLFHIKKLA